MLEEDITLKLINKWLVTLMSKLRDWKFEIGN
jgi:hypothetical protein